MMKNESTNKGVAQKGKNMGSFNNSSSKSNNKKLNNKNFVRSFNSFKYLTIANIKMFIRDKSALFWSLFFPVLTIGIFGVLDFGGMKTFNVGLVYDEGTKIYAEQLQEIFEKEDNYKFHVGDIDSEITELKNDNRLIILQFESLEEGDFDLTAYMGKENQQAGNVISMVAEKILSDISLKIRNVELPFQMTQEIINTNDLRYIDFIVPGVIAMSLMQGSMFAVIGTIVVGRERGILRRLFATPLSKQVFLTSNIITRTIVSLLQIVILITMAYLVFQIKIVGSLWLVGLMATLGCLVFLALGFLFSSFAKTSETARAMLMPINMLFMFTSGVYFDRSALPKWLFDVTKYLPLTYLSDALKDIMVKGYSLNDQSVRLAFSALSIWLIVLVSVSVRFFKWQDK